MDDGTNHINNKEDREVRIEGQKANSDQSRSLQKNSFSWMEGPTTGKEPGGGSELDSSWGCLWVEPPQKGRRTSACHPRGPETREGRLSRITGPDSFSIRKEKRVVDNPRWQIDKGRGRSHTKWQKSHLHFRKKNGKTLNGGPALCSQLKGDRCGGGAQKNYEGIKNRRGNGN